VTALIDPANFSVLGGEATSLFAVSFAVNETDSACGPGRWSLSLLQLPLSQVANATANIQLQLYTVNVSHASFLAIMTTSALCGTHRHFAIVISPSFRPSSLRAGP
jgi:hypothetical protein